MNRLSIILAIAFVSYSLGAPENISEAQSGDQNYGLKNGSDHGLEKQDEYGDGNVNGDTSTSDPSKIGVFVRNPKPKPGGGRRVIDRSNPNNPNGGTRQTAMCAGMCTVACISGAETSACMMCMSRCL